MGTKKKNLSRDVNEHKGNKMEEDLKIPKNAL